MHTHRHTHRCVQVFTQRGRREEIAKKAEERKKIRKMQGKWSIHQ